LIFEGNSIHGCNLAAAEELTRIASLRQGPGGSGIAVGQSQAGALRRHRQLTLKHTGLRELSAACSISGSGPSASESVLINDGHGMVDAGIPVHVRHVHVVHDSNAVVDVAAPVAIVPIEAATVPRVVALIWRQGNPAHVAKPETYARRAETEEGH
jgi:hypothetical protein